MKRAYLIVLVALVLGSCEKEDDDPIVIEPDPTIQGRTTFYITTSDNKNIDFPITVSIDGKEHDKKLNGSPSSGVNCDIPISLGLRIYLDPGTYNFKATDEDQWSNEGTITVESDVCKTQRLLP